MSTFSPGGSYSMTQVGHQAQRYPLANVVLRTDRWAFRRTAAGGTNQGNMV